MKGYLYILQSLKNSSFYIGSTYDLNRRIADHSQGKSPYTSHVLPIKLVFFQEYPSLALARKAEVWVKKQKDRKLLERLIKDKTLQKKFG